MSLEERIEKLTSAVEQLTAIITNNSIAAGTSASVETVKGASAEKAATTKSRTKVAPKKEEPVDDLELDGPTSDTPADDGLGLDEDDGLGLDDEPTIDQDTLKEEFKKLAKKTGGREAVQDILKKFKATSFGDLKPESFKGAYDAVQKALK